MSYVGGKLSDFDCAFVGFLKLCMTQEIWQQKSGLVFWRGKDSEPNRIEALTAGISM